MLAYEALHATMGKLKYVKKLWGMLAKGSFVRENKIAAMMKKTVKYDIPFCYLFMSFQ